MSVQGSCGSALRKLAVEQLMQISKPTIAELKVKAAHLLLPRRLDSHVADLPVKQVLDRALGKVGRVRVELRCHHSKHLHNHIDRHNG